jgi:hypothetical protein
MRRARVVEHFLDRAQRLHEFQLFAFGALAVDQPPAIGLAFGDAVAVRLARRSPPLLLGTVLGLALVYLVPPFALLAGLTTGTTSAAVCGGLAWLVMAGTYAPMLRYYGQPLWLAPLLPLTAFLYLLMTVDSAVQHYRGRGAAWKGRTYARPEPAADES